MGTLVAIFLFAGAFFSFTGAVGVLRMPDFYSRLHPVGKNDTLGATLILLGLCIEYFRYNAATTAEPYDVTVVIKLILTIIAVVATAPTATHAITRAAYIDGLVPWQAKNTDTNLDAATTVSTDHEKTLPAKESDSRA